MYHVEDKFERFLKMILRDSKKDQPEGEKNFRKSNFFIFSTSWRSPALHPLIPFHADYKLSSIKDGKMLFGEIDVNPFRFLFYADCESGEIFVDT